MTLENVFYTPGIICMSLTLILLVTISVLVYIAVKRITQIHDNIEKRINTFLAHKNEAAVGFGATLADTVIHTVQNMLQKKKRRR